jgi:Carboxypeptidase regulatory-like domain
MKKAFPFLLMALAVGAFIWGAGRFDIGEDTLETASRPGPTVPDPDNLPSPPGPLPAGEAQLRGTVLTLSDRPVGQAEVRLFRVENGLWLDALHQKPWATATTDRLGRFEARAPEIGGCVLVARAADLIEGIAVVADLAAKDRKRVVVRMSPPASLSGIVKSEAGAPLPGATVTLRAGEVLESFLARAPEFGNLTVPRSETTLTDEEGKFLVEGLSPSVYDLVVTHPDYVTEYAFTVTAPARDLRFFLRPAITVTGVVSWGRVEAPESVRVWVEPDGPTTMAEIGKQSASFELVGLLPGDYTVHVLATDHGAATTDLHLESGIEPPELQLRLIPGTEVTGRVIEVFSRRPIPNATVVFSSIEEGFFGNVERERARAQTDAEGRYRIVLPAGRWRVAAEAPDHVPPESRAPRRGSTELPVDAFVTDDEGGKIEHDLWLKAVHVLTGRVLHPDGTPADAYVYVSRATVPAGQRAPRGGVPRGRAVHTDAFGYYRIEGVAPFGEYEVTAALGRGNVDRVGEVTFEQGRREASVEDLTIEDWSLGASGGEEEEEIEPAVVTGRIVTEDGEAVPLALVSVGGVLGAADGEGRFWIPGIEPGTQPVRVVAPASLPATLVPVHLGEGRTHDLGDLILPAEGVRVMGTALGPGGIPIPDVSLKVRFEEVDKPFTARTDAQGNYELRGPTAQRLSVSIAARAAGYTPAEVTETLVGTRVVDLLLAPVTFVTIEVRSPHHTPPVLSMVLRPVLPAGRNPVERSLEPTGKRNTWALRGIHAGTWKLILLAEGFSPIPLGRKVLREPSGHHLGRHDLVDGGGGILGRVYGPGSERREGVLVTIPDLGLRVRTDQKGNFRFDSVPEGTFALLATGPVVEGHRLRGTGRARVREGKISRASIRLR